MCRNKTTPICDFDERKRVRGSLDYIRFEEVCRVQLFENEDVTDRKGNAYFRNFMVERGPEAYYTFRYMVDINEYDSIYSESK